MGTHKALLSGEPQHLNRSVVVSCGAGALKVLYAGCYSLRLTT